MIEVRRNGNFVKVALIFLVIFIIAGCARYSLVSTDKELQVGKNIKVKTPITWNKTTIQGVETWTIDGPQLQSLMFFKDVEEGKPLFDFRGQDDEKVPVYKSSMTPLEIVELVEATLAKLGEYKIITKALRPANIGALGGFRFELSFETENGLRYSGLMTGAQKDGKLLGIMYVGTDLYYYQKHLEDVEQIISSVRTM